jgi:hypothetical protein
LGASCLNSRLWIVPGVQCRRKVLARAILALLFSYSGRLLPAETAWTAIGPTGGDARSFAAVPGQPSHLFLGTTNNWIYESTNEGTSWHRLAKLDPVDGLIVAHIVVDAANPRTMYVAGWRADRNDGGLWVSHDGGRNWDAVADLHGQKIFSLVQAPSDPKTLYAGTLNGVYRSSDAAASWTQISPPDSQEIHEIESLAVDPTDSNIVYAGTWHLPWKTDDGGKSWHNIKEGLIDDSDVFSIVVDPERPRTVFLSACSGIYKSENAGERFRKIQGIPSTARRTRVLMQDPEDRETVFAGTTEGLYKTTDGGRTFNAMIGADLIVNDVYVDPQDSNHVLLATDRSGVLASTDGGASFADSNQGISERKVEALLVDHSDAERLYAGVVNDKNYGGVFVSANSGESWAHIGEGLDGRDVFALAQAEDGTILAGTSHGIFALETGKGANEGEPAAGAPVSEPGAQMRWQPRNTIANTIIKASTQTVRGTRVNLEKPVKAAAVELDSRVNALDLSGNAWLASTSAGLLTSRDQGETWQGGPVMGSGDYLSVASHGDLMAAARTDGVVFSTDAGLTWMPLGVPTMLTRIHRVAFSEDGKTWLWIERLPFRDVDDLTYDAHMGKVLVSTQTNDQIYAIDPKTLKWQWWQTGYRIELIRAANHRLLAASLFEGVLIEPQTAGVETGRR